MVKPKWMDIPIKFQQCTTRFKDYLLKDLAQPEFAKGYLEAALQDFDKDGNIEMLLLSMKDVAEAQGGIKRLVAWTNLSGLLGKIICHIFSICDILFLSIESNGKEFTDGKTDASPP